MNERLILTTPAELLASAFAVTAQRAGDTDHPADTYDLVLRDLFTEEYDTPLNRHAYSLMRDIYQRALGASKVIDTTDGIAPIELDMDTLHTYIGGHDITVAEIKEAVIPLVRDNEQAFAQNQKLRAELDEAYAAEKKATDTVNSMKVLLAQSLEQMVAMQNEKTALAVDLQEAEEAIGLLVKKSVEADTRIDELEEVIAALMSEDNDEYEKAFEHVSVPDGGATDDEVVEDDDFTKVVFGIAAALGIEITISKAA